MADKRKLDVAVGGGEVPMGPLGGPAPKTREQLLKEQEARETETAQLPSSKTGPLS